MNFNEILPGPQAYHFEESRKRNFARSHFESDPFQPGAESVNNYLKTLAEIEAEMISASANNPSGMTTTTYPDELNLNGDILKIGNNVLVSPDTLYHGFMEENY